VGPAEFTPNVVSTPRLVAQLESPQHYADTLETELTDTLAPYLLRQGFEPGGDTAAEPPLLACWVTVPAQVPGIETGGSLLTVLDDNAEVFWSSDVGVSPLRPDLTGSPLTL
jgi:hypothetical protein